MDQISRTVGLLLKKNNIQVDIAELDFQLSSHPDFPSLSSVSGVLNHFGVENFSLKVPSNNETLDLLTEPFLAVIKQEKGTVLKVVEVDGDIVNVYNDKGQLKTHDRQSFLEIFDSIILGIEKTELNTKPVSESSRNREFASTLFWITVLVFTLCPLLFTQDLPSLIFFWLLTSGIFVGHSIVKQEEGNPTQFGEAVCAASGTKASKGCQDVLKSEGSKILGFKLSDSSVVYFLGMSVSFCLLVISGLSWQPLFLMNLITIPIILYSVYYQAFVLKSWCRLCLAIVTIATLSLAISFISIDWSLAFSVQQGAIIAFGFLISASLWYRLSSLNLNLTETTEELKSNLRFVRKYSVFKNLLLQSEPVDTTISGIQDITFGDTESPLEIVLVTNPYCGHCPEVHEHMDKIMATPFGSKVKFTIRFNVPTDTLNKGPAPIALRLLEIFSIQGAEDCLQAIRGIYSSKSEEERARWFELWGKPNKPNEYEGVLKKHSGWCVENGLGFTPAILVNGRQFPKEYKRNNLIFFVEELLEDPDPIFQQASIRNQTEINQPSQI